MEAETKAGTVVVAISKNPSSTSALKWALSNKLVPKNGTIKLLHVRPITPKVGTAYKQDTQFEMEQHLEQEHKHICNLFEVKAEFLLIESESVSTALLEQCSRLSIAKLVLGTSSHNRLIRKFKVPGIPEYLARHAPDFCSILVVAKGKLISVRQATCNLPTCQVDSLAGSVTSGYMSHEDISSDRCSSISSASFGSSSSSSSSSFEEREIRIMSQPLPIQRNQAAYAINQRHHSRSGSAFFRILENGGFPLSLGAPRSSFQSSALMFCKTNERELSREPNSMEIQMHLQSFDMDTDTCGLTRSDGTEIEYIPAVASLNDTSELSRIRENENGVPTGISNGATFETMVASCDIPFPLPEDLSEAIKSEKKPVAVPINNILETLDESKAIICPSSSAIDSLHGSLLQDQAATTVSNTFDAFTHKLATGGEMEVLKVQLEEALKRARKAEKVAIMAKHKAEELEFVARREARLHEEALFAEHLAKKRAEDEATKRSKALAVAEAAQRTVEEESRKRREAEERAYQEAMFRKEAVDALLQAQRKYRTYYREYSYEELSAATDGFSRDRRIGEGGYGTVYKGKLHHTAVAIKVLKEGSVQGLNEFQQEVELLGRIHHPHMVLLLGACSEKGCLVYEYLENGSLQDRLFCKDMTPPIPWYTRFRIAAEIAVGLLFLHSSKPEPFVHRDLKPANILLDHNFVSKIGDVGLAKLVPDVISYSTTEYRDTIPVGTLAYIDPEYQRSGVFCPRSDVYALGIVMLQLLTGLPPVGIPDKVEKYLRDGSFEEILDSSAGDWPSYEAKDFALLALHCTELRRRDRPDLKADVLPVLERVKAVAERIERSKPYMTGTQIVPSFFLCPIFQEVMEDPHIAADGFTYEYGAIKLWLQDHNTSPMTNLKLSHKHLTPNHSLRSAILEWRARTQISTRVLLGRKN